MYEGLGWAWLGRVGFLAVTWTRQGACNDVIGVGVGS